jgi:hypothetical protein
LAGADWDSNPRFIAHDSSILTIAQLTWLYSLLICYLKYMPNNRTFYNSISSNTIRKQLYKHEHVTMNWPISDHENIIKKKWIISITCIYMLNKTKSCLFILFVCLFVCFYFVLFVCLFVCLFLFCFVRLFVCLLFYLRFAITCLSFFFLLCIYINVIHFWMDMSRKYFCLDLIIAMLQIQCSSISQFNVG